MANKIEKSILKYLFKIYYYNGKKTKKWNNYK